MKIAYLFDRFPATSETFLAREIAALRRGGWRIEVFAFHAGEGARPLMKAANFYAEKLFQKVALPPEASSARLGAHWGKQLRAENFEHVHAAFASHPAEVAMEAAQRAQIPFSFSAHARDVFLEGGDLKRKISAAKFVACCTSRGAQFLQDAAPMHSEKIFHVPHGLDVARYEYSAFAPPRLVLETISVGRLVEKKGFAVLLEALHLLRNSEYSVSAQIIGEGEERPRLQRLIAAYQLENIVTLCGEFSPLETRRAMELAAKRGAIFVLPSLVAQGGDADGLPNVLLEAAACGLPLLTTPVGEIGAVFGEENAALVPPRDATALAHGLLQARRDEYSAHRRAAQARQLIETRFDIERTIEPLRALFQASALYFKHQGTENVWSSERGFAKHCRH